MLALWDADDLTDVAELLTTELVTNAVLHAMTDAHLQLEWSPPRVHISVRDGTHDLPVIVDTPHESGGYGMRLIAALATAFGVEQQPDGKVVWCQLNRLESERA
jgi:anti-sigma regulatory factor (Ser/Thr protein kinase)